MNGRSVIPTRRGSLAVVILIVVAGSALAWPAEANAQWRGPHHPRAPYPAYRLDELTASLRLKVQPRDAEVYVDGYLAGVVDEFDGIFQRLRLRPGHHAITVYRPGYRTVTEYLYFGPGADRDVEFALEPVAPGESSEPPPPPADPTAPPGDPSAPPRYEPEPRDRPMPEREVRERPARFGSVMLRVRPADAVVRIDGESWTGTLGDEGTRIELTEGRHTIEVSREGYATYTQDVLIQYNRTLTLNVVLSKAGT